MAKLIRESFEFNMKNFIWAVQEFGLKVALDSAVISFTKWFTGAKRIQLTYKPRGK